LVESACDTAVTVTVLGFGRFAGAVYSPLEEIVPTVEFPPMILFTSQVTAVFDVPVTVAVNCCVPPTTTVADEGETLTATVVDETIVTWAEPDFVGSACDTAVTVTVLGFGTFAGAVYSPLEEIVPTVEFPPVTLFTSQVTAVFDVPVTVAVNCCVPFAATVAGEGETVTVTIVGETIATAADAAFVESACDTAVTVTVLGFGTFAGAV
jgi:hypothetical protein